MAEDLHSNIGGRTLAVISPELSKSSRLEARKREPKLKIRVIDTLIARCSNNVNGCTLVDFFDFMVVVRKFSCGHVPQKTTNRTAGFAQMSQIG
jgi:hypothetical protein